MLGRPYKISEREWDILTMLTRKEKKKAFVKAMGEVMGNITLACRAVGITRQTYYNWIDKDPEFRKECDSVNEEAIDFVENKLFSRINDNDTTAIIFYLKTKGKGRGYIEKQDIEMFGSVERPVIVFDDEDGRED